MKTLLLALLLSTCVAAQANPLRETRYCGTPERAADGTIARNSAVPRAFQRIHPCPSTGKGYGACPGWSRNHAIPLACGGCDSVSNLYWVRNEIKVLIDGEELKHNASSPAVRGTSHICWNRPLPPR